MTDTELLDRLIQTREGTAFSDVASDRGGATRFGITKRILSEWRGHDVSSAAVQVLTETEAREIYTSMFLKPWQDVQDEKLRELLFDCGVHHGVGRAKRWLQQALRVEVDGVVGPETKAALQKADSIALYYALVGIRAAFMGELVTSDYKAVRTDVLLALKKAEDDLTDFLSTVLLPPTDLARVKLLTKQMRLTAEERLSKGQALNAHGWLNRVVAFLNT